MSSEWYIMSNKYLSGFEKEEFEKTYHVFDEILTQSPESYIITINGNPKAVIIQSTSDSNKRTVLFKKGDIEHGDIVEFDGLNWLVTDFPFDNRIYCKSVMHLCNEILIFETPKEPIGWTDDGRPIYDDSQSTIQEIPCVVKNITEYNADTNEPINVSEAETTILISNQYHDFFKLGTEFELYGYKNRVIGFNRQQVVNGKGALVIITKKI